MNSTLRLFVLVALLCPGSSGAVARSVTFSSEDGTKLHALVFEAPRPVAGLVVVHGLQSHAGWFEASGTGADLTERGITSVAYDRRGSGRSGGKRGHASSPDQFLQDFEAAVEELRNTLRRAGAADAPVHVLANCFGTRIVIPYVAEHRDDFASLILVSPATHMTKQVGYGLRTKLAILTSDEGKYFDTPLRDDYFVQPGPWYDWIHDDELGLRRATAGFFRSTRGLTARMEDAIPELRVPLLVVLATDDVIVDNRRIKEEFFDRYEGRKALVELASPHYADFGNARPEFRREIASWILAGSGRSLADGIERTPARTAVR